MDLHVPQGVGHIGVDLQHHQTGGLDHPLLVGVGQGQGDVPVLVRHGGGPYIDVRLHKLEPLGGGQVQVVGDVGHIAVAVGLAHLGGEEPAVHLEGVGVLRLIDLGGVGGQAVGHLHALHPVRDGVQLAHEQSGLRRAQPGDDHVAGLDEGQGLFHADILFLIAHRQTAPFTPPRGAHCFTVVMASQRLNVPHGGRTR